MDISQKTGLIYLTSILGFLAVAPAFAQQPAPNTVTSGCAVHMLEPTRSGADCEQIIETLRGITKALADHDYAAMSGYMDENCSTYNERTKKLVTGRDAIIADVKAHVEAEEKRLKIPPIDFTIDHPYVRVSTGETATVNFVLVKEIGGTHPAKFESHCTDVFVKRSGQWKKLLFRGDDWKPVK